MIIRNSVKDAAKNSRDLQRDLAYAGVNVGSSTIRIRLFEASRKARRAPKKQLLIAAMKKKDCGGQKYTRIGKKKIGEK